MASPLAGDLGMHSGRQQVRDVGVSEIVEADTAFELGRLARFLRGELGDRLRESLGELAGRSRAPVQIGADEIVVLVGGAEPEPLPCLFRVVAAERLDGEGGKVDGATAAGRFGRLEVDAGGGLLDSTWHRRLPSKRSQTSAFFGSEFLCWGPPFGEGSPYP